jgi:hypothetical protein
LALVATLALLLVPAYSSTEARSSSVGPVEVEKHSETLVQSEGWGVIMLILIPVLVSATPLALVGSSHERTVQIAASVLLLLFGLLGAASIGLFYLPSALVMTLAAIFHRSATNGGRWRPSTTR